MDVAHIAEEVGDHIVLPKTTALTPVWNGWTRSTPFPYVAGITEKTRLGLSVLIVPYRHPFDVARRVATINVLSGGGGGGVSFSAMEWASWRRSSISWVSPFIAAENGPRNILTKMKTLWTEDSLRYAGEFVKLEEDVNVLPRPLRNPHPSIWVGGESMYALKRVAYCSADL